MRRTPNTVFLLCRTLAALLFVGAAALPALAVKPTLAPVVEGDLPHLVRAGEKVTLRLRFTDADGDRPRKALFFDKSASGSPKVPATRIAPGNSEDGVLIEWIINGFEQGRHQTYFEVTGSDGNTARYPENEEDYYEFVAESLVVKWGIMGSGLLVGLLFVPFLVYVLARAINRRGDPSRAARVGLLLGILACAALFIYLFASFYGALAYAIGILAALALLVVVLTRR